MYINIPPTFLSSQNCFLYTCTYKHISYTPTSSRGLSWSFSDRKSMSLEVTMPTSLLPILPVSVTGIPEKPWRIFASNTSPTVCRGLITTGSVIKPCSNFWQEQKQKCWAVRGYSYYSYSETWLSWVLQVHVFVDLVHLTLTLRTSLAWNSAVQLWWIIPIPPINWNQSIRDTRIHW